MKKIYFTILSTLFFTQISNAQLILTKAINEPVIGDLNIMHRWDSTTALSNSFGPGTFWDFSTLTTNTAVASSNYTTVASTPSASTYPNATFAEYDGISGYNYWKATTSPTTQLELLGLLQPSLSINLNANSAIVSIWPIAFGYNKTDVFSGTASVQTPTANLTGTANGNLKTVASGNGTVVLPGGLTFTNVLQVTTTQTINVSLFVGPFPAGTATIMSTNYQYYHSTQKFPIISINYQSTSGSFSNNIATIRINNNVIAGIDEASLNTTFLIYPNPTSGKLNVMLSNTKSENVSIKIINNIGQIVKTINLGNATDINNQLDLSGLASGVYFVKTTIGNSSSSKKLIKE
ncbi:MAG: T9SS type A sorting domain-containing protein [Bacteroidota bacterium]|nr:T9SS type A sorting domain-containing protein [Bacteroidota bacterium]MDP3146575.1 T9SS type A sorting domain-containing protein [Bacteroidota bacterium]